MAGFAFRAGPALTKKEENQAMFPKPSFIFRCQSKWAKFELISMDPKTSRAIVFAAIVTAIFSLVVFLVRNGMI